MLVPERGPTRDRGRPGRPPSAPRRPYAAVALLLVLVMFLAGGRRPAPIPALAQSSVTVVYQAGWNLVGMPAGTQLSDVQGDLLALSPDEGDYVPVSVDALESGQGYWAYFPQATRVSLPTVAPGPISADAPAGTWILVGNPSSQPVRLSGASQAYQYDPASGYAPVTLLPPGRGAMVTSQTGGAISMAPAVNAIVAVAPPAPPAPAVSFAGTGSSPQLSPGPPASETNGAVTVIAQGFGQSRAGAPIAVAVLLRNDGAPVDSTPLSMTVFDAGGSVIAAGDTTLHYLGAGQTTGFVHRLRPSGTSVAARVTVEAGSGKAAGQAPTGSLSFSDTALSMRHSSLQASALLTSSFASDLSDVHINALLYDASGTLAGGGETIKRLVPADGSVGVVLSVEASGTPARVEFYAQLP